MSHYRLKLLYKTARGTHYTILKAQYKLLTIRLYCSIYYNSLRQKFRDCSQKTQLIALNAHISISSGYFGSVVERLKRRAHDQPGLRSKPTRAILLCPSERHFTAFFPAWVFLASNSKLKSYLY